MSADTPELLRLRSADGTDIVAQRHGSGAPLLLVHGTTARRGRWRPLLPRLSQHFSVYAMDRRGRGDSGDGTAYALEREYEDVAAVIDALGAQVPVLAHSYGAICALGGANLAGHGGQLVLYEPPVGHLVEPAVIERIQTACAAGDPAAGLTVFLAEVLRLPPPAIEQARRRDDWPARTAVAPTIARELRALHQLGAAPLALAAARQAPVELILGGDSIELFQRAIGFLARHLPKARVHVLEGQQHQAIDADPEGFVDLVLPLISMAAGAPES